VKTQKKSPPCQKRHQNGHKLQNDYKYAYPRGVIFPGGAGGTLNILKFLKIQGGGLYLQSCIRIPYKAPYKILKRAMKEPYKGCTTDPLESLMKAVTMRRHGSVVQAFIKGLF
jgi:hypothetical protein